MSRTVINMRALLLVACLVVVGLAERSGKLRCGENEVESCVKTCPPEKTCNNRDIAFNCLQDDNPCTPKCICADGYYRNGIAGCIPEEQCETLQCGPHEVASCVNDCPPEKTCRNRHFGVSCLDNLQPCSTKCICADGYFRNAIGECITEEQCDKCQMPNEFYSCNSACDNVCTDIAVQNRTHCPILNIKCNEWCYCDDGYARDAQRNCVPVSQCHQQCTDPNEIFTCKTDCPPETCISLVAKFKCDSKKKCRLRCACKPGFLRVNDKSPCIPMCQCPQMANSPDCLKKSKKD